MVPWEIHNLCTTGSLPEKSLHANPALSLPKEGRTVEKTKEQIPELSNWQQREERGAKRRQNVSKAGKEG